jgi:hypothetical protein
LKSELISAGRGENAISVIPISLMEVTRKSGREGRGVGSALKSEKMLKNSGAERS